ncbi:MAG: hypothetical protein KC476_06445 [Cyanobacteria bacterium HKST-UBA06]|nr:hypothetical protein [Cyanobacteria bacterium HKST-UBA06]
MHVVRRQPKSFFKPLARLCAAVGLFVAFALLPILPLFSAPAHAVFFTQPLGNGDTYGSQLGPDVIRWHDETRVLNIYVADGFQVPGWTPVYRQYVLNAIKTWQPVLGDRLRMTLVTDPKQADVFVDWYARIPTSWGMSASTIGVTSRETQGRWLVRNDVHLALYDRGGQLLDSRQMQTSASHELGHVLGLTGHSKHPGDLMHHSSTQAALSVRDANTLRAVYAMPARITNRPGIHLARYRDSLPPVQLARPHPSYSTTAAGQPAPAYTGYQSPPTAPSTTPPTTSPSEPGFGSVFDTVLDTVFGGRGR